MNFRRWIANLVATPIMTRRRFPTHALSSLESAIASVEARHAGEIRFVIETALDVSALLESRTPRERAVEVFAHYRVWDTENNNGVLIYLLMAEHDVEIVADRGIASKVSEAEWQAVCHDMEEHFRAGRFREGAVAGVEGVAALLALHFPHEGGDRNEQPNRPILL